MTGERMYPILSYPDLDDALDFYAALGFERTYRQQRPNPYAVVRREDMSIHLAGVPGMDPGTSMSSVIIQVPDAEAVYASFRDGLRKRYGRVPTAAIPRLLRPRRRAGTTAGFTVVDPGGNWLRFYRTGDVEDEPTSPDRSTGLARAVEVAARQGDAHGDHARALSVLDAGLLRHPDAPPPDRVRALLYRADLLIRLDRADEARACLDDALAVPLDADAAATVADELADLRAALG